MKKPAKNKRKNRTQRRLPEQFQSYEMFTKSAWLLYTHRDQILSDPQMTYAPVDMYNALMYFGNQPFAGTTLGVYLEWWQTCEQAVTKDADGRQSLIVCFGGSPLSGWNKCRAVTQDGTTYDLQVPHFSKLWIPFSNLCQHYAHDKQPQQQLCLEDVIHKLTT